MSNLLIQAGLMERYGPRMSMDELAAVLKIARHTINNQVADGSFPVRTYRAHGRRFADIRDVADYLDHCRGAVGA